MCGNKYKCKEIYQIAFYNILCGCLGDDIDKKAASFLKTHQCATLLIYMHKLTVHSTNREKISKK